jgi:N utilization substance protein B
MASRRRKARVAVMQTLFELERRESKDPNIILMRNLAEEKEVDISFAQNALAGILTHDAIIRRIIEENAPEWPLMRMDGIARALLLLGTYEIVLSGDAPPAVVMDEAIEIAKEYGTQESAKFVNGVLNAIAHAPRKENT